MLLVGVLLFCQEIKFQQVQTLAGKVFELSALKNAFTLNGEILIRTLVLISTFAMFTNLSATLGTVVLTTNAVLMQVVSLAAYVIDGLAFATEILAGVFRGKGTTDGLMRLVRVSGGSSVILGLMFAIAFILSPKPLFGLLTNHTEIIDRLYRYVYWLLPVLGFGSIAYMLDGYFLGLTQGSTLRQSTLIAALVGFVPVAIAAWYFRSNNLLWLSLSLFMVVRAFTLGLQVPRTLRN